MLVHKQEGQRNRLFRAKGDGIQPTERSGGEANPGSEWKRHAGTTRGSIPGGFDSLLQLTGNVSSLPLESPIYPCNFLKPSPFRKISVGHSWRMLNSVAYETP